MFDFANGAGRWAAASLTAMAAAIGASAARAAEGMAEPWQTGFQPAASPVMNEIRWFHDSFLLPLTIVIAAFVLLLLVICAVRFNARANPTPSRTTHNTALEVAWTLVPVLILVAVAIPSFRLLYFQLDYVNEQRAPDITVKAIGEQWYWSYEYPDHGDISFDSYLVEEADLKPGQPRLLTVDAEVVVPVGKVVRLLVTADPAGVIHAWAIPAFGVKIDAVPGRLNETWFKAERTGLYYGQCSELCGRGHAFMPIAVRVVTEADFSSWVETAKTAGLAEAYRKLAQTSQDAGSAPRTAALAVPARPAN
ncbi:MAG: cytochrome c oxidase subunit II [Rhodobiaceae bacterium]|nr:cytochrome c oxidase subunit II [Rhodobiaceae bacterium]